MKKIVKKKDFLKNLDFFIDEIKKGKLFIFPTDTIYGIGCIADNEESINRIRELKKRDSKPFSIIAPSKVWIIENCELNENSKVWVNKLPGKYTIILNLKEKNIIANNVNPGKESVGIRIPNNWFSEVIFESGLPFVATSVNISGERHLIDISEIRSKFGDEVDYIIDEGIINGEPSTIVDLSAEKELIIRN